ncbi:hypothetical protein HYPBUDRAFT_200247 [Hyphopichia burtonii NRRL Y-1933]|uniref:Kinase-like protein n=1 Tax=Hyphopichia burtonii NRRL Y-1933 TaxID=984485 RepID=A0A1E4RL17_9ASCO|nr:hypothetical protein HYPBUDRAFT_200247 [Hyphopichia burtonii NRRL Y-1933]ODV67920.1 hypothetical protein HYPBUDRAFT_200247 [Hyphopichia burtonii NRRL Y-1933]
MMATRTVDMASIEQQKENITPMPGGRPASKLAANFNCASKSVSQFKQQQQLQREQFESKLSEVEELDDPLEVYVDYIKWTHDNFPQGSNSESGLLALLERCTSCFRDVLYYKNDPRYLKVWLEYSNYSDSPREIFVYLAKKEIGNQLALYYEEFAQYLESSGKINDARQVYEIGIELNARPFLRLEKSYKKFEERMMLRNNAPDSNTSSSIRDVLSVKKGSNSDPIGNENDGLNSSRKRQKLQVFNDEEYEQKLPSFKEALLDTLGLKDLGTIKARIKENVLSPKPWKGEIIKQKTESSRPNSSKFEVYKDQPESQENYEIIEDSDNLAYTIIHQPGKNTEKVSVNMKLVYPSPEEEYCFEEILAMSRRFDKLHIKNENIIPNENFSHPVERNQTYTIPLKDDTFTIPLKDDLQDDENDSDKFKTKENDKSPNSPTITMYSKMAANEVYSMFNDAANNLTTDDEFDAKSEQENTTNYDGFVTETIRFPPKDNQEEPQLLKEVSNKDIEMSTPPTDQYSSDDESVKSSPFIERPSSVSINLNEKTIFNVSDPLFRNEMFSRIHQNLKEYHNLYDGLRTRTNRLKSFQQLTNPIKKTLKRSPEVIINYCGSENYCLRYELGQGGYGTVYLVETERGEYKALKLESPASSWEFYILSEIHNRLRKQSIEASIYFVIPESISIFEDESYLILNYVNQGTLLDVVNYYKNQGTTVDETLVIFFTIELLKTVESLHSIGIIHGDLKADNCMIRFKRTEDDLPENYSPMNEAWKSKGITMIDFGRALDLTILDSKQRTEFLSEWNTDEQDCPAMRNGQSWSFDADYYGIAAILHTLLFGEYIQVKLVGDGRYNLLRNLKRWWQAQLWMPLFDFLLNPYLSNTKEYGKPPLVEQLRLHREEFEKWLMENSGTRNLKRTVINVEDELNGLNNKLLRSLK